MSDWLKRAEASLDDGMYTCPGCNNKFPYIQLKPFKEKRLCPSCIKIERDKARTAQKPAERKPSPVIDAAAIESLIKSSISEAIKGMDISRIESVVASIKEDLKKAPAPQEPSMYLPGTPSELRLFFEICKNKRVIGGNLERAFGMHQVSLVHVRLLSMWHDNLIWKDGHGWFMINPEMTKPQLEMAIGVALKQDEYDDYMKEIITQAIKFKFRPFFMLTERKQKELEREIALLGTP